MLPLRRVAAVEAGQGVSSAFSGMTPSRFWLAKIGTGTLEVDGKVVAEQKMAHTIPLIMQWDENLDVGSDTGTPVADEDYRVPFPFNGTVERVTLKLDRPVLTDADKARLEAAMQKAADQ